VQRSVKDLSRDGHVVRPRHSSFFLDVSHLRSNMIPKEDPGKDFGLRASPDLDQLPKCQGQSFEGGCIGAPQTGLGRRSGSARNVMTATSRLAA
jgi:hypothetical protein